MSNNAWDGFYMLLRDVAKLPTHPSKMKTNWTDPETGSVLGIAWPDLHIGIAFETSVVDKQIEKNGWQIFRMNTSMIVGSEKLLETLVDLTIEKMMQESLNKAQSTTSKIEDKFLRKLLNAGIPVPDRNMKIYNEETGGHIATPDFAWKHIGDQLVKTIVEIDGIYWHALKESDELLETLVKDKKAKRKHLDEKIRSSAEQDSSKRRELQARGWQIIVLSTEDIEKSEKHMDAAVRDIKKTLHHRASELNTTGEAAMMNSLLAQKRK